MESRTQGSRPRTQKKSEVKAKDSLSEDRHSRGQGQECSSPRPRTKDTSASALQKKKRSSQKFFRRSPKKKKKKKKVFTKIFLAISTKKRFPKNFSSATQNFNISKNSAVLEPRAGQFSRTWGLEAKAKDFKICPRGQGRPRGLHLWRLRWRSWIRVVNGPTSSGPNQNTNLKPKSRRKKKTKVKLGLKNLAMLPSYFEYIFVHLGQTVRLRPELIPKFLSNSGPNPSRKAPPDLQVCLGWNRLGLHPSEMMDVTEDREV